MDENRENLPENEILEEETPKPVYVPRPRWQIVLAWIGVAFMIVSVLLYYWHIANGGM